MGSINAIVFVPQNVRRGDRRCSVMGEKLLFTPLGRWMSDALSNAGVRQFFVVFEGDDCAEVRSLFPEGTEYADKSTDSPEVLLHNFLIRQEPGCRTLVLTRPLFLCASHVEEIIQAPLRSGDRPVFRFQEDKRMSESGMFSVGTELLMGELRSGKGFDLIRALLEVGDPLCESAPVIGDRHALMAALPLARAQVASVLIEKDVDLLDPDAVWICPHASISAGTMIYPGCVITQNCIIGENCVIGPDTWLENTVVENGAKVISSRAEGVTVPAGTIHGPFSVLLPPPQEPEPVPQPEALSKKQRRKLNRKEC